VAVSLSLTVVSAADASAAAVVPAVVAALDGVTQDDVKNYAVSTDTFRQRRRRLTGIRGSSTRGSSISSSETQSSFGGSSSITGSGISGGSGGSGGSSSGELTAPLVAPWWGDDDAAFAHPSAPKRQLGLGATATFDVQVSLSAAGSKDANSFLARITSELEAAVRF
jgi:hypothetical protein